MKQAVHWVAVLAILSVVFAGCGQHEDPVLGERSASAPVFQIVTDTSGFAVVGSTTLEGYTVAFDGRSFANDQTTFSYTVTGTGAVHNLSHFVLGIPDCAPALVASYPAGGTVGTDPTTGVYGIKWDISVGTGESRSYSITFSGDVPLGAIHAAVKAGNAYSVGDIGGPCGGYVISGTVYADADSSGAQVGADETGIANVTVAIADGGGAVLTATTDANGDYGFLRAGGTYTVRIDPSTTAEDFNETLDGNFDPSGPTEVSVTVGPDAAGTDFGFFPRTKKITLDIASGQLLTTGEGPRFWIEQLRGNPKAEFDSATMLAFLNEIEGLFLPVPFQFTEGNEFREAFQILKSKSKDPVDQLLTQLLAAELNHVSGKGLVGAVELQRVMLAWVESLLAQPASSGAAATAAPVGGIGPRRAVIGDRETSIKDAVEFLEVLNGATGGGGAGGEG